MRYVTTIGPVYCCTAVLSTRVCANGEAPVLNALHQYLMDDEHALLLVPRLLQHSVCQRQSSGTEARVRRQQLDNGPPKRLDR